jgi:hypothetical protein
MSLIIRRVRRLSLERCQRAWSDMTTRPEDCEITDALGELSPRRIQRTLYVKILSGARHSGHAQTKAASAGSQVGGDGPRCSSLYSL